MARQISQCRLEAETAPDTWTPVTTLHDAEWTGFAPAGCGVDQGRVIATPLARPIGSAPRSRLSVAGMSRPQTM